MSKLKKKNGIYIVENLALKELENMELENSGELEVEVSIVDKRHISGRQRRFFYALLNEVERESGSDKEQTKAIIKSMYFDAFGKNVSLGNCSMSEANRLIEFLITFIIAKDIPLSMHLLQEEGYKFTYSHVYAMCFMRKCCICGMRADLHHMAGSTVGMGRNRKKISHIGKEIVPLCRASHTEIEQIGEVKFMEKYHIVKITVDKALNEFILRNRIKVIENNNKK